MRTGLILAAASGLTLIGASPPSTGQGGAAEASGYPPCSRSVTDRCVQTYERGAKTRAHAQAARGGPYEAAPAPIAARSDYPPCSATVTDRCNQLLRRHARSHRIRAAGERG